MTTFHQLTVGAPYNPTRRQWPECAQYNYRSGQHELVLFFDQPSEEEVEAVRAGACEFALVTQGIALALLWHFAPLPWGDAPYLYWKVPDGERLPPRWADSSSEDRALLTVILVDARTGIVQALRAVSWSPAFTVSVHLAIRRQIEAGLGPGCTIYDRDLERLLQRPTAVLVTRASARTTGGE